MGYHTTKKTKIITLGVFLFILAFSVYSIHAASIPKEAKVVFLDVGQGDAIFIQSPSGTQMLIDAGKDKSVVEGLHRVLPLFDRHIDIMLATHPDLDHIGGFLFVLKRFDTDLFVEPGSQSETDADETIHALLAEKNIQKTYASRGDVFNLGAGLAVTVLYPYTNVQHADPNESSIIALVTYGEHRFLLTGDASIGGELELVGVDAEQLQTTVLKLGHHGSNTSTHELFLQYTKPEYAIVSAGRNNSYGHPHQEVVERVKKYTQNIFSTQDKGSITFSTDGQEIAVEFQVKSFQE